MRIPIAVTTLVISSVGGLPAQSVPRRYITELERMEERLAIEVDLAMASLQRPDLDSSVSFDIRGRLVDLSAEIADLNRRWVEYQSALVENEIATSFPHDLVSAAINGMFSLDMFAYGVLRMRDGGSAVPEELLRHLGELQLVVIGLMKTVER